MRSSLLCAAATAAIVVCSQPASAQSRPEEQDQAEGVQDAAGGARIEEIIVTAQKREQSLNSVGLTLTAISGEALAERNLTSLQEIASASPGLNFTTSPSNTPILTIRGVGFDSRNLGATPSVSVYLDQQPLPFPVLALHEAYDLERVEVLKGPQGTLFGQNATGGAINFIAAKPTSSPEAGGDITYGRFNRFEGNAYISGPLSDSLRGRIAISGAEGGDWQTSLTRPKDKNGAIRYLAGRAIVDWDAADWARFSLNANGWIDRSPPQAPQLIGYYPSVPGGTPAGVLPLAFPPETPRAADWGIGIQDLRGRRDLYHIALRGDFDLPGSLTLTSLTSYIRFTQAIVLDVDGTAQEIDNLLESGNIRTFTQELRLANNPAARFRWIAGANYEDSHTYDQIDETYPKNSVALFFQGTSIYALQDIRNYAFFGNGEFDILPPLTFKAGIRYTNSRNNAENCTGDIGDGSAAAYVNFLASLSGKPFVPVGSSGPLNQRCASLTAAGLPSVLPTRRTLSEDNVSWRAGLDLRVTPQTLLYANISKGYKGGTFPVQGAVIEAQYTPVTQESVLAYEIGLKTDMFDRRAHLNLAAFYYDYKDKQVIGRALFPPFGPQGVLVNVPKSRIFGIDTDLTVQPTRDLTLTGALTYLDTRIREYTGFDGVPTVVDFAGSDLPFAPKWNYSVDANYSPPIGTHGKAILGATVHGQSSQDTVIGGDSFTYPVSPTTIFLPGITYPYKTNPYALVDLRAGYEDRRGWKVIVFGKNVFDKYYWVNVSNQSEAKTRYTGMPATYGVTFSVKFR